ncbi:LOW QUALITY PROTEIN: hypothetical protein ACHAWX_005897 [Stephanocyclus meneghinianus]
MGKRMEGGTGMVAYGKLASLLRPDLSGMDGTGLARWSYMTFSGKEGHLTTVVVGYNPFFDGLRAVIIPTPAGIFHDGQKRHDVPKKEV